MTENTLHLIHCVLFFITDQKKNELHTRKTHVL